ncbi:hypothetical protein [Enterococcus mundtii]|uniref:hypothetical protein n=1 Tax=Enterococcus mundtii TaxID=53346 RepID=UPI001FB98499|nr:hypothetical protein [Enterococcus mundtii]GKS56442.1 hypothetical protein EMLAB_30570 [Enterococcus mundtii]
MSELTKELEQDKAFIEEVANRIYLDSDDIEDSLPDPEWIDRMTEIADKYITRFETSYNFANNLADELLASNIQLNDNQKIVFDYLKSNVEQGGKSVMYSIFLLGDWDSRIGAARNVDIAYCGLNGKQEAEVLAAFAQWGLEQEES